MKPLYQHINSASAMLLWLVLLSLAVAYSSFSQSSVVSPLPISFSCDGHAIHGFFYPGSAMPGAYTAILLHGFPPSEGDLFGLGEALSKAGLHALTFTYTGTHRSEGVHTYAGPLADIKAAIEFLGQAEMTTKYGVDTTRIVLIGHCYGGAMAFNYAARYPTIKRMILLEPVEPGEFARAYLGNTRLAAVLDSSFDALQRPGGPINFGGKEDLWKTVRNSAPYDLKLNAPKVADRDILLVTGWDDYVTTTEGHHLPVYRAVKKVGSNQMRLLAFHTDHGFRKVREELAAEVIRWIEPK